MVEDTASAVTRSIYTVAETLGLSAPPWDRFLNKALTFQVHALAAEREKVSLPNLESSTFTQQNGTPRSPL